MKTACTLSFLLFFWTIGVAQNQAKSYPCQNTGYEIFPSLIGTWKVETIDRTSPGNYETNVGQSVISQGIDGCSIKEAYRGKYKGNDYAVEAVMLLTGSSKMQRVYFDSEHANTMIFIGSVDRERINLRWVRNPESNRMQVKYELTFTSMVSFEWKTHLTTDYAETWQLTHHWKYTRVSSYDVMNEEHLMIKTAIDNYHKGLSTGNSKLVTEALADQFIMFNGNFSGEAINWQAHMFLTDQDLVEWPKMFAKEAGPYLNNYDIISISSRGASAVIVTRDTGSNKFRQWSQEQTVWLMGKIEGEWRILGHYLKDISNPG